MFETFVLILGFSSKFNLYQSVVSRDRYIKGKDLSLSFDCRESPGVYFRPITKQIITLQNSFAVHLKTCNIYIYILFFFSPAHAK